jgi:hypothetical protein
MGEARHGLALPLVVLQARPRLLAGGMVPETPPGGCGAGPCALGLTNVRAGGAVAVPRRCRGACDQAAIGHTSLHPGTAHPSMHRIQEDQSQDCAKPGARWPPGQRRGMVWRCRVDEGALQVVEDLVGVAHEPAVYLTTLVHGRLGTPRRDASPVRLISQLRAKLGPMVLAGGLLKRRAHRGPLARERQAAPEAITGGPPRGGIAVGRREQAATPQHGALLGVDRVVFGLAAVERLHLQRVPEDTGQLCLGAAVGEPGPGQETCDRADPILPIGGHGLEPRLRTGLQVAMPPDRAVLAKDTHVQAARRQIKAAIRFVRRGVESPEVSSSSLGCVPNASSPTAVCRGGGLNTYQPTAADGGPAAVCSSGAKS